MSDSTQNQSFQPYIRSLRCLRCGAEYEPSTNNYVCACRPNVGSDLGTLDVQYNYHAISDFFSPMQLAERTPMMNEGIVHYAPLLPLTDLQTLTTVTVGDTPFINAPRLAQQLGLTSLYIKDDGRNPSGSLKDRASAIAVSRARSAGMPIVATASTGNAAAALASQCAANGQANVIFVPRTAPPAKLAQLLAYGSHVIAIDGSYDQAFDLCTEACKSFGWYNRNTGYNPYMTEGKKTVSFEIAEQFAAYQNKILEEHRGYFAAPDAIFVSVGDGCIIGGVHKGFKDLLALGWIERMPRIYGVQSIQSAALYEAWRHDWDLPQPIEATTRADSINVNAPRDPIKALAAVRESGGAFLAVPDQEILAAILPLAQLGGVFAEPAGATALAGLTAAVMQKLVKSNEEIVIINTGIGLKDVAAVMQVTGEVAAIPPTLEAVYQATTTVRQLRG